MNKSFPRKNDPFLLLFDAMFNTENPSRAIEKSEKRGQDMFVNSETLPKRINIGKKEQFEKMGNVFGEDADNLFIYVILPDGWKKQ